MNSVDLDQVAHDERPNPVNDCLKIQLFLFLSKNIFHFICFLDFSVLHEIACAFEIRSIGNFYIKTLIITLL